MINRLTVLLPILALLGGCGGGNNSQSEGSAKVFSLAPMGSSENIESIEARSLIHPVVQSTKSSNDGFLITAPDTCENGAVCPVNIDIIPPLVEGDSFVVTIDEEEAALVKVLGGDLSFFGARYKTPSGSSSIQVRCIQCNREPAERVVTTSIGANRSTENTPPGELRVRSGGTGDLMVLISAYETISGFAFFDTDTTKVLIKQTPLTVRNPFFWIKGSFGVGNHCFAFQTQDLSTQCISSQRALSISPESLLEISNGLTSTSAVTAADLFLWAELNYPTLFPPGSSTQIFLGYEFRFYPTTYWYLAVSQGRVYIYNTNQTQGRLVEVGALTDFVKR